MAVVTVAIEDLNTWLSNQPANTVDTPYEIEITSWYMDTDTNRVTSALTNNPTKYVDLQATTIPSFIRDIGSLFSSCKNLIEAPLIPQSVKRMVKCFSGCTNLKNAPIIPEGITSLQETFAGCKNLISAPILPSGLKVMRSTFGGCTNLINAPIIPQTVENMAEAFFNCTKLTEMANIPTSVTNMNDAYANCTSLSYKRILPSSISSFNVYGNVPTINWRGINEQVNDWVQTQTTEFNLYVEDTYREVYGVDISNLATWLSEHDANTVDTAYEIKVLNITSSNVDSIRTTLRNNSTRYVDLGYTEITVSMVGTYPVQGLFGQCTSLVGAPTLAEGITDLDQTYRMCTYLKKVPPFPSSITLLQAVFANCSSLSEPPELPPNVENINNLFQNCYQIESAPTIPNSVTNMTLTFYNCLNLKNPPVIPNGVTKLQQCFYGCHRMETAPIIPNTVTDLRETFRNCYEMANAPAIPNGITSLDSTFMNCRSIENPPSIPSSVTNMSNTFKGCTALKYIPELPSGVTNLTSAFEGCTNVRNSFSTKTVAGISIWNATKDANQEYHRSTVFKDWASTVEKSFSGDDFVHDEYAGYTLSSNVAIKNEINIIQKNSEELFNISAIQIVKNLGNNKLYFFQAYQSPYYTPRYAKTLTEIGKVQLNANGTITLPNNVDLYFDNTFPQGDVYTDSTMSEGGFFGGDIGHTCYYGGQGAIEDFVGTYETMSAPIVLCSTEGIDCTFSTTVNVPSTVTSGASAFKNCSNLQKIDSFGVPLATLRDNANFQNMFQGCDSLTQIGYKINEAEQWHVFRLKFNADSIEGVVYDVEGNATQINNGTPISVTKTSLKLPLKTDELWFPDSSDYSDAADIDALIEKVIQYKYSYFKKSALPPDKKSFVMWADDPDSFETNLNMGGGSSDFSRQGAYCDTDGSIANKTAKMIGFAEQTGQTFPITFAKDNTYDGALTLSINNTTAYPLYINGSVSSSSNKTLPAGTYLIRFAGTVYYLETTWGAPYARYSEHSDTVVGVYTGSGGQQNPQYVGKNRVRFNMMNTTINGNSQYKDFALMDCYSGHDVGGAVGIGVCRQSMRVFAMRSDAGTSPNRPTSWANTCEINTSTYTQVPTSQPSVALNNGAIWVI